MVNRGLSFQLSRDNQCELHLGSSIRLTWTSDNLAYTFSPTDKDASKLKANVFSVLRIIDSANQTEKDDKAHTFNDSKGEVCASGDVVLRSTSTQIFTFSNKLSPRGIFANLDQYEGMSNLAVADEVMYFKHAGAVHSYDMTKETILCSFPACLDYSVSGSYLYSVGCDWIEQYDL